ncbi:MAG: UxaA family hydrolase, partial [Candidatus Bathyarchaeota archaeon]
MEFKGIIREDGRVGVRNYVGIVSTVFCSSSVAQKIADATGANVFIHDGGCGQLGPVKEHTERILDGVVTHPNIGGVLTVGVGCEQIDAESLAGKVGEKPHMYLDIQKEGGNAHSIEEGIRIVKQIQKETAKAKRTIVDISELKVATQCGSSDTGSGIASNPTVGAMADMLIADGGSVILGETGSLYGAAGLMARRAATPEIGAEIIAMTDRLESYYGRMGHSFKKANPTPGNIEAGLTTLVEKSLGGVRKGGTTTIQGVLKPGEELKGKGLWIMDTSLGLGACASADMLASGAQILVYTTGKGNPVGSPLGPVIKVTATRRSVETLRDIIDFDGSPVLMGEETVEDCGRRLYGKLRDVAEG